MLIDERRFSAANQLLVVVRGGPWPDPADGKDVAKRLRAGLQRADLDHAQTTLEGGDVAGARSGLAGLLDGLASELHGRHELLVLLVACEEVLALTASSAPSAFKSSKASVAQKHNELEGQSLTDNLQDVVGLQAAVLGGLEARANMLGAVIDADGAHKNASDARSWKAALRLAVTAVDLQDPARPHPSAAKRASELKEKCAAGLAKAQEVERAARYDEAISQARAALFGEGGHFADHANGSRKQLGERLFVSPKVAKAATAHALRALKSVPDDEAATLTKFVATYEQTRNEGRGREAREQLTQQLRDSKSLLAQTAWRLLEHAKALEGLRGDECLIPRLGSVRLWSKNPLDNNPLPTTDPDVGPFYMDRFEVTRRDFLSYLERPGAPLTRAALVTRWLAEPGDRLTADTAPIRYVTFSEAKAYAASVEGRRLPTTEEWEVAATVVAGSTDGDQPTPPLTYPWGWGPSGDELLTLSQDHDSGAPARVGSNAADVSPWGCRDMGGSVSEYVVASNGVDPVLKGGAFDAWSPQTVRLAYREVAHGKPLPQAGFRCARDVVAPDLSNLLSAEGETK